MMQNKREKSCQSLPDSVTSSVGSVAGQIWIYTHVTEIPEFCKQDGWHAVSRQKYKEDLDHSDDGLDYS